MSFLSAITPIKLPLIPDWSNDFLQNSQNDSTHAYQPNRSYHKTLDEVFSSNHFILLKNIRVHCRDHSILRRFTIPSVLSHPPHFYYVFSAQNTSEKSHFEEALRSATYNFFDCPAESSLVFVYPGDSRYLQIRKDSQGQFKGIFTGTTVSIWREWHSQGIQFTNPLITSDGLLSLDDLTQSSTGLVSTCESTGIFNIMSLLDWLRSDCVSSGKQLFIRSSVIFDRSSRIPIKISACPESKGGCTVSFDGLMDLELIKDVLLSVTKQSQTGFACKFDHWLPNTQTSSKLNYTGDKWEIDS
jgi:hypothetical protein